MVGSHHYKYFYTTCPRTGTASMTTFLRKQYKGQGFCRWHRTIVPEGYENYFRFMTVRNPYERLVSIWWWCHAHKKDPRAAEDRNKDKSLYGFLEWMIPNRERTLYPEKCMIWSNQMQFYEAANIQAYYRLENINDEVHNLPFAEESKARETVGTLHHKTVDERSHWKSYYDKKTERLAYEHSLEDFKVLQYPRERFRING